MASFPHEKPASKPARKQLPFLLYNEGKNQGKRENACESKKVTTFMMPLKTVILLLHEKLKKPIAFFMKA